MAQDEQYFETADLGLAAALVTSSVSLLRLNKSNPRRVIFLFKDSTYTKEKVNLYWSKELSVPALALLENMRILKTRIYG